MALGLMLITSIVLLVIAFKTGDNAERKIEILPTFTPVATAEATETQAPTPIPETTIPTEEPTIEPTTESRSELPLWSPTETRVPVGQRATATPTRVLPSTSSLSGYNYTATRYGASYNGSPLGCGSGVYSSGNPGILAAPPSKYHEWPCGTPLQVCSGNACIWVTRVDSCPGCGSNHIDLSESGIAILCGYACDRITGLTITVLR